MEKRKTKKRIRLLNKKRFFTVMVTLLLVVISSVSVFISASALDSEITYKSFIVHRGDTLWSIAKENAPENMDVREYIYRVEKLNGISNSFIAEGQELKLPDLNE